MKLPVALLLIFASASAAGAEQGGPLAGGSLAGTLMQTFAALAVVVGLILVCYYAGTRLFKSGLVPGSSSRYIRVIETRFLAPKKSLVLVEVGGEYLLLALSGENLQLVKQIDMLEEIEVLETTGLARCMDGRLPDKIIDLVARRSKRADGCNGPAAACGGKS